MIRLMRAVSIAAAMAAACGAGAANAQDWQARASYGSVQLASGFTPDPYNVNLSSGGPINAQQTLGANCPGFVANAPDFDLVWQAGNLGLPLVISVNSQADTTLVVHMPNGQWVCEDDGGNNGFNPGLRIDNPQSGLYDIWVGTYGSASNHPAVLSISELVSH